MRIQRLPALVANQIAAGEVIERPASVVKELLENSLDAQATVISIEIGYGGLNHIKIADNGMGIMAEDLPLAIAAHATSKISQLDDLYSIVSMGFRGEALASIASISRLTISSKPVHQSSAMMLTAYGNSYQLAPCARSQGTTIEVHDIFCNAPVRKKFLKTAKSEFQAIEMVVKRFALSAPTIAITLSHNGKTHLNLPAANCDKLRLTRIQKLLGKPFLEQSIYLEVTNSELSLTGWLSTKDYQRSQNDKQWIYVNQRMVKDKLLNHAIKQAYESLLYPGRHPACLLYFSISPAEVDVNVHPTKHEVRFQQPRLVHDFISSQIQQVLQPTNDKQLPEPVIPEKKLSFQLRETFLLPPVTSTESNKLKLIALNASFSVVFVEDQPYLVDMAALQSQWLLAALKQEVLPLAKRPLLVPIGYSIESILLEELNNYRLSLSKLGIEFDIAGENKIIIRTLPIGVPRLNIKQFLNEFFKLENSAPHSFLFELLVFCQTFNAQSLSHDEKEMLVAYMQTMLLEQSSAWCKQLSLAMCQDLFNG